MILTLYGLSSYKALLSPTDVEVHLFAKTSAKLKMARVPDSGKS